MNREAGLEYGFSWWRRAAAVAAAGTLSLSLVGCEKPADEESTRQAEQSEVTVAETTPSVEGDSGRSSSKYPNIKNIASLSDSEYLRLCFMGEEYALSWKGTIGQWEDVATKVNSTRCEGKGYPSDGWKNTDGNNYFVCIPRKSPDSDGELHYYLTSAYTNGEGGHNISSTDHGRMRMGLDESCDPNPGPGGMVE